MSVLELVVSSVLFSIFGVVCEIFFTAIYNTIETRGKSIKGEVSLLMFPVYFFAYLLFAIPLVKLFSVIGIGLFMQCLTITALIYLVEYCAGILYDRFGHRPWHYEHSFIVFDHVIRFDLNNKITLLYFPVWMFFAYTAMKFHNLIAWVFHLCAV